MSLTTVAVASDHAGYEMKERLKLALKERGLTIVDLGSDSTESVDYPDHAHALADTVADGRADLGVIVCGTGIGVSIAANRHPGIRAAVCSAPETASLARAHNDANVLALGARVIDEATALACLDAFLSTPFEGGRHASRVQKINR